MDPNQNNSNPFNLTPDPTTPNPASPTFVPTTASGSSSPSPADPLTNLASPQGAIPTMDNSSFPAKAPWQSSPSANSTSPDLGSTATPPTSVTGLDLSAGVVQSSSNLGENMPPASSPFSFTPPDSSTPESPTPAQSEQFSDTNSTSNPLGGALPSDSSSSSPNIFGNTPPADTPSSPLTWSPPSNTSASSMPGMTSGVSGTDLGSTPTQPNPVSNQTDQSGSNPTPLMPMETPSPETPNLGLSSDLSSLSSPFNLPTPDNRESNTITSSNPPAPMLNSQPTALGEGNATPMPSSPTPNNIPSLTPVDNAPTDLSHLVNNSSFMPGTPQTPLTVDAGPTIAAPATQSMVPSSSDAQPTASVSGEGGGSGFPKAIIFLVVGVLLIVLAAVAYFVLGVGKSVTSPTSIPLNEQRLTNPPAVAVPTKAPTPQPPASSSANLNNSQSSSSSSALQGSSAVNLLKQNTSTSSAK